MFSYNMSQQLKKSPEFIAQTRAAFETDNPWLLAYGTTSMAFITRCINRSLWVTFLTGFSYGAQLRVVA